MTLTDKVTTINGVQYHYRYSLHDGWPYIFCTEANGHPALFQTWQNAGDWQLFCDVVNMWRQNGWHATFTLDEFVAKLGI